MARSFLTGINLNKNELSNVAIQPLDGPPSSPAVGQIYFDTTLVTLRQYTGTVWIDYLNSADGSNYIESVDTNFVVTAQELHLADNVIIDTSLTVGGAAVTAGDPNGIFTVKNSINEPVFNVDALTNTTSFYRSDGTLGAIFEHSYTDTFRVIADDDISIRSVNGDIILYPGANDGGTGKAYIGWGNDSTGANPEREIATKGYVDGVAQGLSVIGSVNAGSIADVPDLTGVTIIGGVTLVNNDRVLLKNQATATQNGIYIYDLATTTLSLSTNLEDTALKQGSYVLVTEGTLAATGWIVTDYTAGASIWTQFSAANEYTAGTAIDITTNAISVKYGDGLTIDGSGNLVVDATAVPYKYAVNNPELVPTSGQVSWDVNHALNTEDVVVSVRDLTTGALVEVDVYSDGVNNTEILFNTATTVAADSYRVTVIG